MKINIEIYKDKDNKYVAINPEGILMCKTYAMSLKTLKELNLKEMFEISKNQYILEGRDLPDEILNFEGFNITILNT